MDAILIISTVATAIAACALGIGFYLVTRHASSLERDRRNMLEALERLRQVENQSTDTTAAIKRLTRQLKL
jgi:hypothetical protein